MDQESRIVVNADGSATVTLLYPISAVVGAGEPSTISTITMRRPKAKDLKKASGKGMAHTLALISTLSAIAPPFLDELDGEDTLELGKALTDFLGIKVAE